MFCCRTKGLLLNKDLLTIIFCAVSYINPTCNESSMIFNFYFFTVE